MCIKVKLVLDFRTRICLMCEGQWKKIHLLCYGTLYQGNENKILTLDKFVKETPDANQ